MIIRDRRVNLLTLQSSIKKIVAEKSSISGDIALAFLLQYLRFMTYLKCTLSTVFQRLHELNVNTGINYNIYWLNQFKSVINWILYKGKYILFKLNVVTKTSESWIL